MRLCKLASWQSLASLASGVRITAHRRTAAEIHGHSRWSSCTSTDQCVAVNRFMCDRRFLNSMMALP